MTQSRRRSSSLAARTVDGHHQQSERTDRKAAVIGCDCPGRSPDPVQNLFLRQGDVAGRETDMDHAAGHLKADLWQLIERVIGHAVSAHELGLRVGVE
jgi:hypothetical protein